LKESAWCALIPVSPKANICKLCIKDKNNLDEKQQSNKNEYKIFTENQQDLFIFS